MNRLIGLVCAVLLISCCSSISGGDEPAKAAEYQPRMDKDGWEILFDGKDLNAWRLPADGGGWEITDAGELHVVKKGPSLFSKQRYCDYVIECDFKVAAKLKSNSGVYLRTHDMKDPVNTGFEIQILDDASYDVKWDALNANGALYDMVPASMPASNPPGEWNHFRITVNGSNISVELNSKEIVKADVSMGSTISTRMRWARCRRRGLWGCRIMAGCRCGLRM
jgi:hypothetical protein